MRPYEVNTKPQFALNLELSSKLNDIADIVIIVNKTNRKALISNLHNFKIVYVCNAFIKNLFNRKITTKIGNKYVFKTDLENAPPPSKKCAYVVDTLDIAKKLFAKFLNSSHILLLLNLILMDIFTLQH